ncbi:unnamed protein product [Diplocarpon coronariae]
MAESIVLYLSGSPKRQRAADYQAPFPNHQVTLGEQPVTLAPNIPRRAPLAISDAGMGTKEKLPCGREVVGVYLHRSKEAPDLTNHHHISPLQRRRENTEE